MQNKSIVVYQPSRFRMFYKRHEQKIWILALAFFAMLAITIYSFDDAYADTTTITVLPVVPHATQGGAEGCDPAFDGLEGVECAGRGNQTGVEGRIRAIAQENGFRWPDYLVRLARCESRLNPKAVGDGGYYSRGLFQISKYYHPTVSDECAFSVSCSTEWTINKINAGQQSLWSCDRIIRNT